VDVYSLHKAEPRALTATLFVGAELGLQPDPAAATAAGEILARVHSLAANPKQSRLRLSGAARKVFDQAMKKFAQTSADVLPPLADYYAAAADLVCRLAVNGLFSRDYLLPWSGNALIHLTGCMLKRGRVAFKEADPACVRAELIALRKASRE
jgi:hypothetical protein